MRFNYITHFSTKVKAAEVEVSVKLVVCLLLRSLLAPALAPGFAFAGV